MLHHWQRLRSRVRQVFFGPAYQPADHAALRPRGSRRGSRAMLAVTGTVWLGLVLFDNVARPWQHQPKSWKYFQGPRELNEQPNLARQPDAVPRSGIIAQTLGVAGLARPYLAAENTAPIYMETDANGFRAVRSRPPFAAVLCGDSFTDNNSLADSLAAATGLSVGNQGIQGRTTLSIARFLEEPPAEYRQTRVIFWESTQRATLDDFKYLVSRRQELRQAKDWYWKQSLLWPGNVETYIAGSSLLKTQLDKMNKEIKWALTHKHTDDVILGRRDLPAGVAPLLFLHYEESLKSEMVPQTQLDSIADYIAAVDREVKNRGQQVVFFVAPEKSIVYPNRLPADVQPHTNYIPGLTQALQRRGVHVADVSRGLRQAAAANPQTLYYYAADTHWTPAGMGVAARILADSLARWHFTPMPLAQQ